MELTKIILLALLLTTTLGSARAACVIQAEDPIVREFFRQKGFEVDSISGDFRVEFEVTCEAVDQKKEKFSASEIHRTTTKVEVFNQYENQRVVYHAGKIQKESGRVHAASLVPCADTRAAKAKLLEEALIAAKEINCEEE